VSAIAAVLSLVAAAAPAPAPVTLTVRYSDRASVDHVAHLRCRGDSARADGYLRNAGAATACRRARAIAVFLATRPSSKRICTQIYGGRQRAHITGTIGARRIDRRLKRTDGCEIGDWQRAVPLVPRVPAGVAP
jgi:hypothetical protein